MGKWTQRFALATQLAGVTGVTNAAVIPAAAQEQQVTDISQLNANLKQVFKRLGKRESAHPLKREDILNALGKSDADHRGIQGEGLDYIVTYDRGFPDERHDVFSIREVHARENKVDWHILVFDRQSDRFNVRVSGRGMRPYEAAFQEASLTPPRRVIR